jgi:hypothetical protein
MIETSMIELIAEEREGNPVDGPGSNIPFCLFFILVKLCRRAPSRGANGCRVTAAMVLGSVLECLDRELCLRLLVDKEQLVNSTWRDAMFLRQLESSESQAMFVYLPGEAPVFDLDQLRAKRVEFGDGRN